MLRFKFSSRKDREKLLALVKEYVFYGSVRRKTLRKYPSRYKIHMQHSILCRAGWKRNFRHGKVRFLILCITRWKCNLFSLSSCHEFCREEIRTTHNSPPGYNTLLVSLYIRNTRMFASVCDMMRRVRSRFICVHSCVLHEFAYVYNVFLVAFGSKLFKSFIRRDSLLTRRGETRCWKSAMECWSSRYESRFRCVFSRVAS